MGSDPQPDFSTPEGAVRALEDAYRRKDVEGAVGAKSFRHEAELMLQSVNPDLANDEEVVSETARALELSFRSQIAESGFRDFTGVTTSFPECEIRSQSLIVLTEVCTHVDGRSSTERLMVAKTSLGWRVLNPLE